MRRQPAGHRGGARDARVSVPPPFDTYVPYAPVDGAVHRPEVRVRGLQLHTLHPIEGYFAFWEPSPGSRDDAQRIADEIAARLPLVTDGVPFDVYDLSAPPCWRRSPSTPTCSTISPRAWNGSRCRRARGRPSCAMASRSIGDLRDTHARRLIERRSNRTFYQYGYLFMADTLCYWQRELLQMQAILGTGAIAPPSCLL